MKARFRNRTAPFVWTGVVLLFAPARYWTQQPPQQSHTSQAPAQTSAAPSSDLAGQEDALIKKCNKQMNVEGHFKEAEETAKQAVELSQKMGDKNRILVAQMYLGSAYSYEGNEQEALEIFKRTADLARGIGNRKGLSRALNNIAGVLANLGRYEESLDYMDQCMNVARELGDVPMQYTLLTNIGRLYMATGDPDKAEAPFRKSLRMGRDLKHSDLVSNPSKVATEMSLMLLGGLEVAREHYQAALKYLDQARESHPDSAQTQIELLNTMSVAYRKLGQYQKAADVLQEAMPIAEKANTADLATLIVNLGEAQESLGHLKEALATENRALRAFRDYGMNSDQEWEIEWRIGHIDRALSRREEALSHYENSVQELERLRAVGLNTEAGRAGFGSLSRTVYDETADLLHDMHRDDQALEVAERGRARAFLDMLAVTRSGLPDELTPEQRKREDELSIRVSSAQKSLWKENVPADEERKLQAELTSAEDDLEAFHLEVRHSNPRYATIRYPEPIRVGEIQNRLLDDQTALVEFLLGEKRSLVWVVTRRRLSTSVLPARKLIEKQVAAFRKLLAERASALTFSQSQAEIHRLGAKLYASLFRSIETDVASSGTLIIVPDGTLNYLPFEALVAGSRHLNSGESQPSYLIQRFAFVYGPSASALVTVQEMNREREVPSRTLLAFGDPVPISSAAATARPAAVKQTRTVRETAASPVGDDYTERGFSLTPLPYTRHEVLTISRLFPPSQRQVYLGAEAREETVKSAKLDEFRYIHFASHGFIDEAKPDRSGILLSRDPHSAEDGVLQMAEIMRLKTNADLITLSACSTGLGKLVNGEGIIGLTRAFFYSGARNVAVSLWNVNDSSTAALMEVFYQNLNRGLTKSAALRQAKLALLHGKTVTWSHPYFWAPFVLVGEGK